MITGARFVLRRTAQSFVYNDSRLIVRATRLESTGSDANPLRVRRYYLSKRDVVSTDRKHYHPLIYYRLSVINNPL